MTFRLRVVLVLLFSVVSAVGTPRHLSAKVKTPETGYLLALATANRFLNAWQAGDLETGMVLLSDDVRRSQTPESLEILFASGAGSRAFEINRGKSKRGRYRFPVVMLSGEDRRLHRKFSEIILVNNGKNDWVVDRLP